MTHGSRRMVSGLGRIACAIAAMLLCGVAMGHAGATAKVAATKAAATTQAAATTKAPSDKDCLGCHNLKASAKLQARPVSVYVNAEIYEPSVHSSVGCVSCHTDIRSFPHPDPVKPVSCAGCHANASSGYASSVHAIAEREKKSRFPGCLNCHGNPHGMRARTDPKSRVYPLNLPRTCGTCHGNPEIAKKYGFPDVYALYMDSIHGFALTSDGLLVAATCASCHGAHDILSRKDPKSRTFPRNVPATCGGCHAGVQVDYLAGAHGTAMIAGRANAPVCTNCHTAHQIAQVDVVTWQLKTVATCGNCHKERLHSYRDTFHGQVTELGFVATARCWSCHGSHLILKASDPKSKVAPANLPATCGKCHHGATASFVSYEPHPNAHDRRQNPALYYSALFMNLLLLGVFFFFGLHTALWLARSLKVGSRGNGNGVSGEQ
jgi:hypothetical protein